MFLGLGSNIEPREVHIESACNALEQNGRITLISSIVQTEPWGYSDDRPYLNAVCEYRTNLKPLQLLSIVEDIEREEGRTRKSTDGYRGRTLDIDILFYDDQIIHTPDLMVPHPRLHLRNFVLVPLAEIAPDYVHPELHLSVRELLERSTDSSTVENFMA